MDPRFSRPLPPDHGSMGCYLVSQLAPESSTGHGRGGTHDGRTSSRGRGARVPSDSFSFPQKFVYHNPDPGTSGPTPQPRRSRASHLPPPRAGSRADAPTRRRAPRPALRPARPAERDGHPRPARRRLRRLDRLAGPGRWPTCWPSRGPSTRPPRPARRPGRRATWKLHGGDPEKSLAALDLNRSTRESLAAAGGPDVEATLAHVGSRLAAPTATPTAPPPTPSAPPPPTASGSASSGRTPAAGWAPSSWRSTAS